VYSDNIAAAVGKSKQVLGTSVFRRKNQFKAL